MLLVLKLRKCIHFLLVNSVVSPGFLEGVQVVTGNRTHGRWSLTYYYY